MKIAVTGASGHLGSVLVRALEAQGDVVIALRSRDADLAVDECIPALSGKLEGVDAIAHLAAWHPAATAASTPADRTRLLEVNTFGTMRLLEAAVRASVRSVVYVSTFEVYGTPATSLIDEEHSTYPLTDYGVTKLAGEDHVLALANEVPDLRAVVLRMPAIYGPGERTPRILPNSLERVLKGERPVVYGDGGDLRDQIFVDDAARATRLALGSKATGIFNVADGAPHSVGEIARTAMRLGGMDGEPQVEPRQKPRLDFHMSTERAARELGFGGCVSLEEGMKRQLAWLRAGRA
jgi:UDP-glucose 4-epimerase